MGVEPIYKKHTGNFASPSFASSILVHVVSLRTGRVAAEVNRGTGSVHELVFDERHPVPGVHLQHFDIVPRLMPVMRDSCRKDRVE